ncbi:MAG: hypothetical protein NT034_02935, partial [Candidatus Magasanikbacteria bacterium]|nr:hypothetical protein [Candidatus Magasanikbacteria bacterium]
MKLLELLGISEKEFLSRLNEIDVKPDDPSIQFELDVAYFNIKDLRYKCEFTRSLSDDNKSILEFKFKLINNPDKPTRNNFDTEQQYQIALHKSQVGITKTGNSFMVFSKVTSALRNYLNKNSPSYVTFEGDDDHKKLYQTLIKRLKNYFPDYKNLDKNPITKKQLGDGEFWLEKVS